VTAKAFLLSSIFVSICCTVVFDICLVWSILVRGSIFYLLGPFLGSALLISIMPWPIGIAAWRYLRAQQQDSVVAEARAK